MRAMMGLREENVISCDSDIYLTRMRRKGGEIEIMRQGWQVVTRCSSKGRLGHD